MRVRNNKFVLYFVVLSLIGSFFNYITYPVLARVLPDNQFVSMTVALSLLTQMSTIMSSLVAISTSITKEKDADANNKIEILQTVIIYLLLVLILIFLIVSPLVLPAINLNYLYLIPICSMLLFAVPVSVISGYLNGKKLLVKLGLVVAGYAVIQFIFSVYVGIISKSGIQSLIAMALGQLISIVFIYIFLRNDQLPNVLKIIEHNKVDIFSKNIKKLVLFTILSSVGVMIVNLLQITDLLAVQSRNIDNKMYTDLYIIGRAVFFAGTIFIWPLVSSAELKNGKHNLMLFKKFILTILFFGILSIAAIAFFGRTVTTVLFGTSYSANTYSTIGVVSIVYKLVYIILYSLIVFFTVMKNKLAFTLPVVLALANIIYLAVLPKNISTIGMLTGLTAIATTGLCAGLYLLIKSPDSTKAKFY